jgi:hypothetical protein
MTNRLTVLTEVLLYDQKQLVWTIAFGGVLVLANITVNKDSAKHDKLLYQIHKQVLSVS